MNRDRIKTIIYSTISFTLFIGALVSGIYAGTKFQKDSSQAIKEIIDSECKSQTKGESIFATLEYENSSKNISAINKIKKSFDEPLYNQLSKAEFDVTIKYDDFIYNSASMIESKYYDTHYDTLHIYSNTRWEPFDYTNNGVYISTNLNDKIKAEFNIPTAVGISIEITANGITKEMTIGGTYLSNVYPNILGFASRADELIECFDEIIIMHDYSLLDFNPSKAIAMFASGSSNNGSKYNQLSAASDKHSYNLKFASKSLVHDSFVKNIQDITKHYENNNNTWIATLFLLLTIVATSGTIFALIKLFKVVKIKDEISKRNNILTVILISISIIIPAAILLAAKKIVNANGIPILNTVSMIISIIVMLIILGYVCIRQRKIILSIFKEKDNNSEFNY